MAEINGSQKFASWPKTEFHKIELILRKNERTFINKIFFNLKP